MSLHVNIFKLKGVQGLEVFREPTKIVVDPQDWGKSMIDWVMKQRLWNREIKEEDQII